MPAGGTNIASAVTFTSPSGGEKSYASAGLTGSGNFNFEISGVPYTSAGVTYTLTFTDPDLGGASSTPITVTVSSAASVNNNASITPVYDTTTANGVTTPVFSGFMTAADPNYPLSSVNPYALQMLTLPYDFTDNLSLTDRFGGAFGLTTLNASNPDTLQQIAGTTPTPTRRNMRNRRRRHAGKPLDTTAGSVQHTAAVFDPVRIGQHRDAGHICPDGVGTAASDYATLSRMEYGWQSVGASGLRGTHHGRG